MFRTLLGSESTLWRFAATPSQAPAAVGRKSAGMLSTQGIRVHRRRIAERMMQQATQTGQASPRISSQFAPARRLAKCTEREESGRNSDWMPRMRPATPLNATHTRKSTRSSMVAHCTWPGEQTTNHTQPRQTGWETVRRRQSGGCSFQGQAPRYRSQVAGVMVRSATSCDR